jgi:hypothetical protein
MRSRIVVPQIKRDDCHELLPFLGDLWFQKRRL